MQPPPTSRPLRFKLCYIMRKKTESQISNLRVQAQREHVATSQMEGGARRGRRGHAALLRDGMHWSFPQFSSSSLLTNLCTSASRAAHQSMTPSPYEEISDQLALIRAVLVSSIICVSLPLATQKRVYVHKHTCRAQTHTHTDTKFRATVTLFAF